MRLTYLAHASLLVESEGLRLVTDPWLTGPTYLGAWWHFPEPAATPESLGPVDAIYLTHEHVDHFHLPSLRRFAPTTPILIGKFFSQRFRRALERLGFSDVRELPHGVEVTPGGLRVTSYQSRADDTAVVLADREGTVLNLNDSLLRGRALEQILERHGKIDLLAASFANAEAYPIVYDLEDPSERPDWDDEQRFDGFLDKVRAVDPAAFTPFASMFCFLSEELFGLNPRIVAPTRLLERAAREVSAVGLPMKPGDVWTPARGHERVSDVRWEDKPALLRAAAERHRAELDAQAAAEVVPGGQEALRAAFASFFTAFIARVPWPLKRRLDLEVCFDTGAGDPLWLRLARGRLSLDAPPSDDGWDARVTTTPWVLWRALTGQDTWQSFGISCRFRVALRPRVRAREVLFWMLLYLDDLGYLAPSSLLTPRALGVLARRHRELGAYAVELLGGTFVSRSLRGKFAVR
jgi:hypothetical protein